MAKVEFGLSKGHIALLKDDGTYDVPVAVPGLVALTTDPQGEQSVKYADNVAYFTLSSNAGYTGELTLTKMNEELLDQLLGRKKSKNGLHVEVSDGMPAQFALLFQVQNDEGAGRIVFYNCTMGRPAGDNKTTEESIETTDQVYNLTMIPLVTDDENIVRAGIDTSDTPNKAVYDAFFDAVTLPTWGA